MTHKPRILRLIYGEVEMNDSANRANQDLRPKETVQKILVSTTSRMTGEYENQGILIAHAWPHFESSSVEMRLTETHMSRSGYVIAFETPPIEKQPGVQLPNYSPTGETLAAYMAVLFGKRFDCHGLLEGSGFYHIPEFASYDIPCNPKLPFNSHDTRECFSVPLEINQFSMIERVFLDPASDMTVLSRLSAACKFYMQALQNAENNPEVAYLHLIVAGELLAGSLRLKRAKGLKQKFVEALCSLLDDDFYLVADSGPSFGRFEPNNVERSIGAAYDLRSRYLHTGAPFGLWVDPSDSRASTDLPIGRPATEDMGLGEVLAVAPTFKGLERLVRYCVLNLMASQGLLVRNTNG